jgi:phage-related protein
METFGSVMDVLGSIVGAIAPIFDFIGDIVFDAFILPFRIIADVLGFTIPLFVKFINIINKFGNESGLFGGIVNAVTLVRDAFAGFIEFLTGALNDVIDIANVIPGVNIGEVGGAGGMTQKVEGAKITESDVRENLQSDSKEAGPSQANTTPPNINVENNVNNTANVDAESDEKEQRIQTLVDRALREADTRRRRGARGI